jgi:hypothetical protein
MDHDYNKVTAYFVVGTPILVSLHGMGTFSFDMTNDSGAQRRHG